MLFPYVILLCVVTQGNIKCYVPLGHFVFAVFPMHTPLQGFPYAITSLHHTCWSCFVCIVERGHDKNNHKMSKRLTWLSKEAKWLIDILADEHISPM